MTTNKQKIKNTEQTKNTTLKKKHLSFILHVLILHYILQRRAFPYVDKKEVYVEYNVHRNVIQIAMSLQYDPNGTIASEMSLQGKPWDVCLVNPFTVAVSLPYNKPWNMSYVSTIAIVDTIQMKTGKLPMKLLVTSQSQMWVVGLLFFK